MAIAYIKSYSFFSAEKAMENILEKHIRDKVLDPLHPNQYEYIKEGSAKRFG